MLTPEVLLLNRLVCFRTQELPATISPIYQTSPQPC